jgi:exonuclease SbcD
VGSSLGIYHVPTKSGEVQIAALPWPRKSSLLSRDDAKNLSMEKLNQRIEQAMVDGLMSLVTQIDHKLPAILAAHISVANAQQGSEKTMLVGRDPVMLLSNIARPEFDYVALGHIHRHQVLHHNPPVVYSGSLERLDFSDEEQAKGFYIIDINCKAGVKSVDYQFNEIDVRRFASINIEVQSTDLSPMHTILTEIEKNRDKISGAIVKLQINLTRVVAAQLKEAEIYKALQEAYYVTIGKQFTPETRSSLSVEAIERLTPLDALRIYLESKNVPEDRVKILMEYGTKLIQEIDTGAR